MKFGRKIKEDMYGAWREKYLIYNELKSVLKARTVTDRTSPQFWNAHDEHKFSNDLKKELDKIYNFQTAKITELAERINNAEDEVNNLVHDYEPDTEEGLNSGDNSCHIAELEAAHNEELARYHDEGSDTDESDDADRTEEKFRELEETVAILVADVHDLALYTKLCFTGFMKILKKHDKRTGLSLRPTFMSQVLNKRPFHGYNWDSLIVKLSRLYELIRTRGHPVPGDPSAGGVQSAFVRQTTKYWVHPDNLVALKLAILRHLPVLVFNRDKEFEPRDAAITSVYLDNEDLELYLGRLEKTEGAEAIRLRWYGDMSVKQIFVERKTHREDWTGEKSVKARFPIKEQNVNAFLRGEYIMDEVFEDLVVKGKKTRQEVENMTQLANEVQYAILERRLQPVMRTFYSRTAFQLPGDARVRISLDTDLTMIREDNWDGLTRSGDNWRRTDIDIDYPFEQVPKDDKEEFKYGVLEVKLQTQFGQEPPAWVTELVNSHLVEAVPKFSKFIHGCATLLPNRVDLVPFWLPQMDIDIWKPDTGAAHFQRPSAASSSYGTPAIHTPEAYAEPVSEGEEDEEVAVAIARDEDKITGLETVAATEAISYRENLLRERAREDAEKRRQRGEDVDGEEEDERVPYLKRKKPSIVSSAAGRPQILSFDPMAPAERFDQSFKAKFGGESAEQDGDGALRDDEESSTPPQEGAPAPGDDVEYLRIWRAQPGKRIAVPVRIEPKVYFACERTFLRWLQFSVVIGSVATVLLNFTKPGDTRGLISATAFTIASLLSIAYSCGIFVYRALKLRSREAEGLYYDKFGPTVLGVVLFGALATNFILRLSE